MKTELDNLYSAAEKLLACRDARLRSVPLLRHRLDNLRASLAQLDEAERRLNKRLFGTVPPRGLGAHRLDFAPDDTATRVGGE